MDLSAGTVEALVKGKEVKYKPILQILGCRKNPGRHWESRRFRLRVSDGKHSNSFALLSDDLNPRLLAGELSNYTVIRLEKHRYSPAQGYKWVMILDFSVLRRGSEVKRKIGNPVPIFAGSQFERSETQCNNMIQFPIVASQQVVDDSLMSVSTLALSSGCLKALMEGEVILYKPVLQMLGYKKIPGSNSGRYRVLMSDGKYSHSLVMLATVLNEKLLSGELENYSVIRILKYACNQVEGGKRILIIVDLSILQRGSDVKRKLGNPTLICSTRSPSVNHEGQSNIPTPPPVDAVLQPNSETNGRPDDNVPQPPPPVLELRKNAMFPRSASDLSQGTIEALMNGLELGYKPVLQMLGYKKVPGGNAVRYRLFVSDGKHASSFALLAPQINPRLLSGELANYAVMRVEKHICNNVTQCGRMVLIILEVSILRSGSDVAQRLGNPIFVPALLKPENFANQSVTESTIETMLRRILTEGSIDEITRSGEVNYKPILQILQIIQMPQNGMGHNYRLRLSDGKHSSSFAVLATELNERMQSGELANYAVIRIEKHACSRTNGGRKTLHILDASVLRPGALLRKKLGYPVPLESQPTVQRSQPTSWFKPVFKILGQRKETTDKGIDQYRLVVSDRRLIHSFPVLSPRLNSRLLAGELETYSVIRVDKFFCKTLKDDWMMVILDFTVLKPGLVVKRRLGN